MQGFGRAVVAAAQGLAVNCHQALRRLRQQIAHKGRECIRKRLWLNRPQETPQRVVTRNASGKGEKLAKQIQFRFAVIFDVLKPFRTRHDAAQRH